MNNHGKVFTINDANQIESDSIVPQRTDVLDRNDVNKTEAAIDKNKPLLFLGNDVNQSIQKNNYELILHGILPCGSKTTVRIVGVLPYVNVNVGSRDDNRIAQISTRLQTQMNNQDIEFSSVETISGKDFMFFNHIPQKYLRFYFKSLKSRLDFIKLCVTLNLKTSSNDKSAYYRVVARDNGFCLSGWNIITKYEQEYGSPYKSDYVLNVRATDIKSYDENNEFTYGYLCSPLVFKYEPMIIASFDIEMIPHDLNKFPDADHCLKDSIFMICVTFHYVKKKEAILSVCLTLKENDPLEDVLTIVCETEATLLLTFSKLFDMMKPEFITEFNGGGFDWRNIITKMMYYGLTVPFLKNMSLIRLEKWECNEHMIGRYYDEKYIKIDGATAAAKCKSLKMQGYINFDTLIIFKQLDPNADSHRLNECLKRCNLGSKDDMEIKKMFDIYLHGTAEEMKMVAHYCFIDTFKLQSLLLKKNVIADRREVSIVSYCSLYDSFYYANGGKVQNLIMTVGSKDGYMFDTLYKPTIDDPEAKFPGAYVVPPNKGVLKPTLRVDEYMKKNNIELTDEQLKMIYTFIDDTFDMLWNQKKPDEVPEAYKSYIDYLAANETPYPMSGLDYASLYPSIIMTYNISPDKLVTDEAYAKELIELGYKIKHVSFEFIGKEVHAWFVQHENKEENYGLCASILIELFAKRAEIKQLLKPFEKQMEQMEKEMKEYANEEDYPRINEYYEAVFNFNYYNAKQKALKVFMNTFYGQMGNFNSFICAVEVAASVTTLGQYNLRLAKTYVEDVLEMNVYYGDTDSLYVTCNKKYFKEFDREYFTGKVDKLTYATNLVNKTFELIELARQGINKMLYEDNGSPFLKVAYEEVLFPVALFAKKNYAGVPHTDKVDFYPKKLFTRGLKTIKRGTSDVLKNIVNQIIKDVLDIMVIDDMLEIVTQATKRFFTTEWEVNDFVKTAVYRIDKNNISVKKMVQRYMDEQYKIIPDINVRFKYVICKRYPWTYNERGNQTILTSGDKMELLERVIEEKIPIDLEYYFTNELTGQLARLIAFYDQFDTLDRSTINENLTEKERYKKIELARFENARKHICEITKIYSKPYSNKGKLFKDTYTSVAKLIERTNPSTKRIESKYPEIVSKVISILDGCDEELTMSNLKKRIDTYIKIRYKIEGNSDLKDISVLYKYITSNKLKPLLKDCKLDWINHIVQFIRKEYDYDLICNQSMEVNSLSDLVTEKELRAIVNRPELYVGLTADQATEIMNILSKIIANAL